MYIDLFAGCGGLSLGLQQSGWEGLFAIEKNIDAFTTLKCNLIENSNHFRWPEWLELSNFDINEFLETYKENLEELRGQIPLVVGGPPCQGFSLAGKRDKNDIRNKLIDTYIKFIELVRPRMIFFENVHGFTVGFEKNGKKGEPFSVRLMKKLHKLGYNVKGQMVDMSYYGVPQKRKRFILVGFTNRNPEEFFRLLDNNGQQFLAEKNIRAPINVKQAIGDLKKEYGYVDSIDSKGFKNGIYGRAATNYQRLMRRNNIQGDIPDSHRFAKQKDETIELLRKIMTLSNEMKRITPKQNLVIGLKKRGITPLKEKSICPTLTSIPDDFIHYCEPRIMTVREYARIQSFPDYYKFKGKYTTGGSLRKVDVPRYTQVANAVPPLFAEQVGLILREML
ncbi:DNA cytosine methyltransferase [Clostridium botulinum]|uniref:DNA cytosine methyltransferase n=1 Tax=Clostridium sporogenes TaxID=1509 RepID=UPI0013CA930C|nr:DNA cytosine methyltransferase [Clostridium sporogenes]MCR1972662.1 DNA cytosine methyltransferase [Clostridium sporogenes]NFS20900.1 DNA cytosine methyltransferase [Clostridium botulinum]